MSTAIGLQHQCLDTLIKKRAIEKLRRAGDLSHEQAKHMNDWLEDARRSIQLFRDHENAVRECLRKEMGK